MKIIIIGGGFAGLSALEELKKLKGAELTLLDRKPTFDFLPAVPDVIGRGVRPDVLTVGLADICQRYGCSFVHEQVEGVDLKGKGIITSSGTTGYDCLLIASGAQTNFYGNESCQRYGYTLYTVGDAQRLFEALETKPFQTVVIAGGGYTGIEAATCVRRYLDRRGRKKRILLVELSPSLLGPLPEWMKRYAADNLERLDVEVRTGATIREAQQASLVLTDGTVVRDYLLIWSAGMKTGDYLQGLGVKKNAQGRVEVDRTLSCAPDAFAAGDASLFYDGKVPLRMAIQFSIVQGRTAGRSIAHIAAGKSAVQYKPRDLGYIIPMANNRSCGVLFSSLKVKGLLPTFLHYAMCVYRSRGLHNKLGLAHDVMFARRPERRTAQTKEPIHR